MSDNRLSFLSGSGQTFDEQHITTAADGIQWQTPNYQGSTQRYDVSVRQC